MWFTKDVLLSLYSSMKKKIRKIPVIFDIEKSNFGTFWHLSTTPICKIQYFPLGMVIFSQKTF